jgi:hypothetical protein
MLDAIGELVRPNLAGMTYGDWRSQNADAARKLANAESVSRVVAFWKSHRDRHGYGIVFISQLQREIAMAAADTRSTNGRTRPSTETRTPAIIR